MYETLKEVIDAGIEKLYRAEEMKKESYELFGNINGVKIIDSRFDDDNGKLEIHVYKGIKNLAEVLGVKLTPMIDYCGKEDYTRRCIYLENAMFFQIGTVKNDDCFD